MYGKMIRESLAKQGMLAQFDPRHIEAFMRTEHPTLDGLSSQQFDAEVAIGAECVRVGGHEMAERVAKSFGL